MSVCLAVSTEKRKVYFNRYVDCNHVPMSHIQTQTPSGLAQRLTHGKEICQDTESWTLMITLTKLEDSEDNKLL